MAAEASVLQKFLEKSSLPEKVVKRITGTGEGGWGLASLADFASVFTQADYEESCATLVKGIEDHKDDFLAVSRTRTAWMLARAELQKACEAKTTIAADEDWDAPLPDDVEATREAEFNRAYDGLSFDTDSTPTAHIIGRFFREFKKRKVSVFPLHRMRSEAEIKQVSGLKKRKLTDDITIQIDGEDTALSSGMSAFFGRRPRCCGG